MRTTRKLAPPEEVRSIVNNRAKALVKALIEAWETEILSLTRSQERPTLKAGRTREADGIKRNIKGCPWCSAARTTSKAADMSSKGSIDLSRTAKFACAARITLLGQTGSTSIMSCRVVVQ